MTVRYALIAGIVAVAASAPPDATAATASLDQPAAGPALEQVVERMASYVASYGEQVAMFVAAERYEQRVLLQDRLLRPRTLTSEFALVRAPGTVGWIGYRDVVEVNGKTIADRRDRLQSLLTGAEAAQNQLRRIVAESARFNVGPIARDLNVPTTALFFFHPTRITRFAFEYEGTKTIEGAKTWRLDFKETARPTLVMRRDGTDVPAEGTVWVVPEDGTVVRTRIRFRNFADVERMREMEAPSVTRTEPAAPGSVPRPASPPTGQGAPSTPAPGQQGGTGSGTGSSGSGGVAASAPPPPPPPPAMAREPLSQSGPIETLADIEVTYRRSAEHGVWLPVQMSEVYEGPIPRGTETSVPGRATGKAEYSNYRQFATSARIVPQ
ncbi:MAG: hypothetical protein KJ061_13755 [Vicinamibacteraceae bacterium]|nr:hypothetical protein [Vicinamibacteraceae bacterium]